MSESTDVRVVRTKKLLKEALFSIMEEREYSKITVQEIARKATLNRATFYLHYYDKDDLLQVSLSEEAEELKRNLKIPLEEFKYTGDNPHPTFIRIFEQMYESPVFYKVMLAEEKIPYFTEQVMEILDWFVREGSDYLLDDKVEFLVPLEIHISYIKSAYLGVIIWWLQNDMPYTPVHMSSQLTLMSTKGPYKTNPYI